MFSQCQSIKWHQANTMLLCAIKHDSISLNKHTGQKTHVKSILFPIFLQILPHQTINKLFRQNRYDAKTEHHLLVSHWCPYLAFSPFVTKHNTIPLCFEVIEATTMAITVFWHIPPCNLVYCYQYFGEACCLHLHMESWDRTSRAEQ
jgi:hypothetical protein